MGCCYTEAVAKADAAISVEEFVEEFFAFDAHAAEVEYFDLDADADGVTGVTTLVEWS